MDRLGLFLLTAVSCFAQADRYITVNGIRIHYLDWGNESKPAFLMLHGIGRVAHTFDHIAPQFKNDYHVLAIDMRGHGDSGWSPEGAYLVEDYVPADVN